MQGSASPDGAAQQGPVTPGGQTDDARRRSGEPPWLRRALLLALAGLAAYQIAGWAFVRLREFLGLLFLAWLFSISLEPAVRTFTRRGMRRGAATGLIMFGLALLVFGFVAVFGALLVDQLAGLVTALPGLVTSAVEWANRTFDTQFSAVNVVDSLRLTPGRIQQIAQSLTPGVVGVVTSVFGAIFQALTLVLFAYYMSAQASALRDTIAHRFPAQQQRIIATVWDIATEKAGNYVFSQMLLAVLNASFFAIVLLVLGVPYWLPLAIWSGLVSEFIPTVGTYLGIGLPALVALADQPSDALWVVVFGTLYQQLENYLIAPRITARTVHMHPAVALGAVIVGATLFGALGALVAIPVVAATQSVIETYGRRYDVVADVEAQPVDEHPSVPRPRARARGRASR